MSNPFFDHPILNSPYECPERHWELDEQGQPTQKILDTRRRAEFITPIPYPKKRKSAGQVGFVFDEGKGLSTQEQQYDPTSIINEVRGHVDAWRLLPHPNQCMKPRQYWVSDHFDRSRVSAQPPRFHEVACLKFWGPRRRVLYRVDQNLEDEER